jgi:hypothetical protein
VKSHLGSVSERGAAEYSATFGGVISFSVPVQVAGCLDEILRKLRYGRGGRLWRGCFRREKSTHAVTPRAVGRRIL